MTGTPFGQVKPCLNIGDSREDVFDMYRDSRENLLEIFAVIIIPSLISSVRGFNGAFGEGVVISESRNTPSFELLNTKTGLGIVPSKAFSQFNSVEFSNAFHRFCCCGNEPILR